jgi:LuxR family maltose regulon positive regulatory protein
MPATPAPISPMGRVCIETKFSPPLHERKLLELARLDRHLAACLAQRLVCFSAPAGFGKTTSLLKQCRMLEGDGWRVAWLSLDQDDNAPAQFLQYLVEAVQRATTREDGLGAAYESNPDSLKAILVSVLDGVGRRGEQLALVLDDYHLIDNDAVHQLVAWLAGIMPDAVRMLIGTRHQLPDQFAGSGACQVGADALGLTLDEAGRFLRCNGRADLSEAQILSLFQKTEGWPAGLQLVAMALQDQGCSAGFISEFSGADCDVGAYLLEAVFAQLPPAVLRFLSLTALFDRFSLALCREALGQDDAAAVLAWIGAHNLFLIPLDHRPRWFRYHHLLSDHLRGLMATSAPDQVCLAYRAASAWFAKRKLSEEAIRYAFSARDFNLAADLIECSIDDAAWRRGDHDRVIRWYLRLPAEAVRQRFALRLSYVRSALWCGRFPQARLALEAIDADLRLAGSGCPADPATLRDLQLCWYMFHVFTNDSAWVRANKRVWSADWEISGKPIDIAPMKLAEACFAFLEHDYRLARQLAGSAQSFYERADSYAGVAGCRRMRAVIDFEQGRAVDARRDLALLYRENCGELGRFSIIAANTGIRLADAAYECNEIDLAREALADSFGISSKYGLQTNFISAFLTMSRVLRLDGKCDAADACLNAGVALGLERHLPRVTLALQAERVRVLLREGRVDDALDVAGLVQVGPHAHAVSGALPQWHARGDGALIAIRIGLATGRTEGLGLLIDDLLIEARGQHRMRAMIKLQTLKVLLWQQMGRTADACAELECALLLGQGGGVLRSIADEGPQLGTLLETIAGPENAFALACLAAVRQASPNSLAPLQAACVGPGAAVKLSPREREILGLIECGFDNRRLAAHLTISEGTAKWHLRNIFQKLDVSSRTAAIARARSLRIV